MEMLLKGVKMLKNDLEKLVKKLQKENAELVKSKEDAFETMSKLSSNCRSLENTIEKMKKEHFNDEESWANRQNKLKQQLKDVSLVCETHLKVNYPCEKTWEIIDRQPRQAIKQDETNDSRFIKAVIEMCQEKSEISRYMDGGY